MKVEPSLKAELPSTLYHGPKSINLKPLPCPKIGASHVTVEREGLVSPLRDNLRFTIYRVEGRPK